MAGGALQRRCVKQAIIKTGSIVRASQVSLPKATTFNASFSPAYIPSFHHMPWIYEEPTNVLYKDIHRRVQARPQIGLWWASIAPAHLSGNKTVRSSAKRRISEAFKSALKESGYDNNGIAVASHQGALEYNLKGSIRIIATKNIVMASKSLLDTEIMTLMDYLSAPSVRRMIPGQKQLRATLKNATYNSSPGAENMTPHIEDELDGSTEAAVTASGSG